MAIKYLCVNLKGELEIWEELNTPIPKYRDYPALSWSLCHLSSLKFLPGTSYTNKGPLSSSREIIEQWED